MPSAFGHALIAAALGASFRARGAVIAAAVFCAVAPDFDVLAFRFGIPYDAPLGHRGFSHSLLFAVLFGAAASLLLRALLRRSAHPPPLASTFVLLALATGSHGFLDAFTDGGLGVAFLSPFEHTRYFLPWRPVAVSPLDLARFLGADGLEVVKSEAVWLGIPSALLYVATRLTSPRRRAR